MATFYLISFSIGFPVALWYFSNNEKALKYLCAGFCIFILYLGFAKIVFGATPEEKAEEERIELCKDGAKAYSQCVAAQGGRKCELSEQLSQKYYETYGDELLYDCDPLFIRGEL